MPFRVGQTENQGYEKGNHCNDSLFHILRPPSKIFMNWMKISRDINLKSLTFPDLSAIAFSKNDSPYSIMHCIVLL